MFQPQAIPATPSTCLGMLQDLNHTQDMPNKAEIHLWTHGDDEETVRAMLEELEDAKEDPEDLEDTGHLYRMVMSRPYD